MCEIKKKIINELPTTENKTTPIENKISIKIPNNNLIKLLMFPFKIISNIYKNILVYIIIFLLFIIAFKNIISLPIEFLEHFIYIPEFIKALIQSYTTAIAPIKQDIVVNLDTESLKTLLESNSKEIKDNVTTVVNTFNNSQTSITSLVSETTKINAVITKQSSQIASLTEQLNTMVKVTKTLSAQNVDLMKQLSQQQNTAIGLNNVVTELEGISQQVSNIKLSIQTGVDSFHGVLTSTTSLLTDNHKAMLESLNGCKDGILSFKDTLLKDFYNPLMDVLNKNHSESLQILGNSNSILHTLELNSADTVSSMNGILNSINTGNKEQTLGFNSLLQATNANEQLMASFQTKQGILQQQLADQASQSKLDLETMKQQMTDQHDQFIKDHTFMGILKGFGDKVTPTSASVEVSDVFDMNNE